MPHLTIEYSDNLEPAAEAMLDAVHAAAAGNPAVPIPGLRVRGEARRHYRVADCDPANAFVAVLIRLAPGRTPEEKQQLMADVLAAVEQAVGASESDLAVAYSVETQEIDPAFRVNRNNVRARMDAGA